MFYFNYTNPSLWLAARQLQLVKSMMTVATKFDWKPEGAQQEVRMLNLENIQKKVTVVAELLESRHRKLWPDVMNPPKVIRTQE